MIERLAEIQAVKTQIQAALIGKEFKNLSTGEKDLLIEAMAKILGLIK